MNLAVALMHSGSVEEAVSIGEAAFGLIVALEGDLGVRGLTALNNVAGILCMANGPQAGLPLAQECL